MKIVIPLAGKDKNFEERGTIKPLTKVCGKEIIKWIGDSRPFPYEEAIFIILKEHNEKYNFGSELKRLFGEKITIIILDEMTPGCPQSILTTKHLINNDEELLIDLADQYIDFTGLTDYIKRPNIDGLIPTFKSFHYNRGYMIIEKGVITHVSEKDKTPISTDSTACVSYFRKGSDYVKYAERMIEKSKTAADGKYLPSLVFNEMIADGKRITTCPCEFIAPLGSVQGADCFDQINRPLKWKQN